MHDFSDDNINNTNTKNLIIAINLGTLNNFLDSEFNSNYKELKKFVDNSNILNGDISDQKYIENSTFQYINFGDFKNYTLTKDGIKVDFIVTLINKITATNSENIFYNAYMNCENCSHMKKCPVRHNYQLLQNKQVQTNIALKLIEMSIKEKYFLSTREIFDFIYSIVVHCDFQTNALFEIADDNIFLDEYINYSLASLMYEQNDISPVSSLLSKYDYLKTRSEYTDEELISFNISSNIAPLCNNVIDDTLYKNVINSHNLTFFNNQESFIKTKIFKFISRTNSLKTKTYTDLIYEQFLQYLYHFNVGDIRELKNLYDMILKSMLKWNGHINNNWIRIGKQKNISIFAEINLKSSLPKKTFSNKTEIKKFENNILVGFAKKGGSREQVRFIKINYSLFKIISEINDGYIPNAQDKQTYIEFNSFVSSLYEITNASEEVCIVNSENKKAIFKNSDFGYRFEVI